MTNNQYYNLYIASCEMDGGIYQYRMNNEGACEFVGFTQMDRPMYMTAVNQKLYVLLREPFENGESGLIIFDISEKGCLQDPSEIISTKGKVACHLTVDGEWVYCANYISGNVIKIPDCVVEHTGKGVNPIRQEQAHTHYVGITPDQEFVCVSDLGLDTIFVYDKNLNCCSKARVPDGHGVRHFVFSDNKKYLFTANELQSTVSALEYNHGKLKLIDTKSCLPEDFKGESTAAAIRLYKGNIFISNRGHDSISKISFNGKKLRYVSSIDCEGKTPRDFIFADELLICANQDSDTVTVFRRNCEEQFVLQNKLTVKTPVCCVVEKI